MLFKTVPFSDQVRFGGVPPTDDSREETFRLAESFAERLGRYQRDEAADASSLDGLLRGVRARGSSGKPSDRAEGTFPHAFIVIRIGA